ncbi:3-hydroxyacyl-ACP dehydratase FabZ [Latilactobacillus fuchuensis]|uniref:3-hydroxyacyl-[acyl-carrier-protein] dehydratase FabZ n=2 Tax=Latilactobacillus fuchuensis TaxID=164393 RepID=A0A2N9DWU7_9LACO|nr:3-hydroxyacyl-ACP dehydratase FabZ [Latilactobacillus fuchuensis]KRL61394.1 fabZ protein [Latilactobacillus fuchuensis DSM 14340 = JCM 11249]MCP8858304.1 3-hydroxyacyl-ACP dehydratase FabZ [Latilactobacillus fuchuensis]SPC39145.1 (3R)-hydroxymyristol acyl carrier protein dehydratase [Latilactobacillus fuchuensis]
MLDIVEIQKILPHRYPMLLIDRVLTHVPGESAVAQKNVTINEAVFQGHFPGNPVLPGVMILESMAQTGAIALLTLDQFKGRTVYFGGIKSAKFRRVVRPGDVLEITVTLEKLKDKIGLGKAIATVDGQKACTAELTFIIE